MTRWSRVRCCSSLYAGDGHGYAASGALGESVPTGWMVTGAQFELGWPTDPQRARLVRSHFGARRKAFNWGLAQVKADMDARRTDPTHESVEWTQAALRKAWNRVKDQVAPWWAENSKEAYSTGLADLATALRNWKVSKTGNRQGRRVGFPRFSIAASSAALLIAATRLVGSASGDGHAPAT